MLPTSRKPLRIGRVDNRGAFVSVAEMKNFAIAQLNIDGLGNIWVAKNAKGLAGIVLKGGRRELLGYLPSGTEVAQEPGRFRKFRVELDRFARGKRVSFGERLGPAGTDFQRKVWRAIASIPWGETRSYKWIAKKAGRPNAVRAAANACGANPLPIVIPCHRVIASDGTMGGFSSGIALKRKLLRLEGIDFG
jgi:O-6-methylguanine DNA methyltransferase